MGNSTYLISNKLQLHCLNYLVPCFLRHLETTGQVLSRSDLWDRYYYVPQYVSHKPLPDEERHRFPFVLQSGEFITTIDFVLFSGIDGGNDVCLSR